MNALTQNFIIQMGCCPCKNCYYRYSRPGSTFNIHQQPQRQGNRDTQNITNNSKQKYLHKQLEKDVPQRQSPKRQIHSEQDTEQSDSSEICCRCCINRYRISKVESIKGNSKKSSLKEINLQKMTSLNQLKSDNRGNPGQSRQQNNQNPQKKQLAQQNEKREKKGCFDFFRCCFSRQPRPKGPEIKKPPGEVSKANSNDSSKNFKANQLNSGKAEIEFQVPKEILMKSVQQTPIHKDSEVNPKQYQQCAVQNIFENEKQQQVNRFKLLKVLGEGGLGIVYLVCYKEDVSKKDRQLFALRQMKKFVNRKDFIPNILFEKNVFQDSRSDFITHLHSAFRDSCNYFQVFEWAQGGDVQSFIEKGSPRIVEFIKNKENVIRFILGCAILGLEYLHERNIAYSNLKPSNLLVFSDGYVKLSDFDVSIQLKKDVPCTFKRGTTEYFAPEMAVRAECKRNVDLWALGILAYQLSSFQFPFEAALIDDGQRFVQVAEESERNRHWHDPTISSQLKDLISRLLRTESRVRLGASGWKSIKNHNFFKMVQFNWNALELKALESPLLPIISKQNTRIFSGNLDQLELQDQSFVRVGTANNLPGNENPSKD